MIAVAATAKSMQSLLKKHFTTSCLLNADLSVKKSYRWRKRLNIEVDGPIALAATVEKLCIFFN